MTAQFTDDVSQNIELLGHLMRDLPPTARSRAKDAGRAMMGVVERMQRENPKDAATTIGIALSAALLLQQLTQGRETTDPSEQPRIELLS